MQRLVFFDFPFTVVKHVSQWLYMFIFLVSTVNDDPQKISHVPLSSWLNYTKDIKNKKTFH